MAKGFSFKFQVEITNIIELEGVKQSLKKLASIIEDNSKKFFQRKAPQYKATARKIIIEVVYGTYQPKYYERTGALSNAPRADITNEGHGIAIVIDDRSKTEPLEDSDYSTYGMYFITGGGLLKDVPTRTPAGKDDIRNFFIVWDNRIGKEFPGQYAREVIDAAVKSIGFTKTR